MAIRKWQGQADAVAQVTQVQVTTYDAATTYEVLVGDEVIASAVAAGTAADTATALASAWNLSSSPYATPITASTSTDTLILTSDEAGVPFIITTNVTGGTGAFGTITTTTANAGPNDWGTAANWSGDTVPISTDGVVLRDSDVDIRWGLDQAAVALASLVIEQTYTGRIGLPRNAVTIAADGSTSTAKPEYREDYLIIGWDDCRIGEVLGPGSPAGSPRLKLSNDKAGASETIVYNTSASSADIDLPAVRLLAANASANIYVRGAPGGVGVAADDPAETSTVGNIEISDPTPSTRVHVGDGVTLTSLTQTGGQNTLRAAANVTSVKVLDGELAIEGDGYAVTTLTCEGGTCYPNNVPTTGDAIGTLNLDGGTVDATRSRRARTWGTVNLQGPGSTLAADGSILTITTLNDVAGPYSLSLN